MDKNVEGKKMEPLAFLGRFVVGGSCQNKQMAGAMIPPQILKFKSLYSLLYKIDLDLARQAKARGCPTAGARCTMRTMQESLVAVLLICARPLKYA